MPFVTLKIAARTLKPDKVKRLQQDVTAIMADVLGKRAELTAVLVEHVRPDSWSIGTQAVPVAAHLIATVTAGTNSADEKARFVHEAHQMLVNVLGDTLPTATYVVVDEVEAGAWGYAGLTQAHRAGARSDVS